MAPSPRTPKSSTPLLLSSLLSSLLVTALAAAAVGIAAPVAAEAGEHGPGVIYTGGSYCPPTICPPVHCHTASHSHACYGSYAHAHGSSWDILRTHLRGRQLIRRLYIRNYFLRRHAFAGGKTQRFSTLTPERRAGISRDGVVFIDALKPVAEGEEAPDALDHLNRGVARFHFGRYEGAKADFSEALRLDPSLHAARYGRALCRVRKAEWTAALEDLRHLARAGEIRPGDRIDAAVAFEDPTGLATLMDTLGDLLRFRSSARIALVSAWVLQAGGRVDAAQRALKAATRLEGDPIFEALAGESASTPAIDEPSSVSPPLPPVQVLSERSS